MNEQPTKGRDLSTGRFLPGNSWAGEANRPQPGEVVEPHPIYANRDSKGRLQPGFTLNRGYYKGQDYNTFLKQVQRTLAECVDPEEIKAVYRKLFDLTQCKDTKTAIAAIKVYLERFFGQPQTSKDITINKTTTKATVNLDLSKLSEDELRTYLDLQGKVQSNLDLLEGPEITIEGN